MAVNAVQSPSTARADWQPRRFGAQRIYRCGACAVCAGTALWTPGDWWVCLRCGGVWREDVWKEEL